MTIFDLKKEYHKKIDPLDFDLILESVLKKPRSFVLAHPEFFIPQSKIKSLKTKIARRLKGEPLAYILGKKEFYGLEFKVNKNVLIPRPETEMMIDMAKELAADSRQSTTIIDVGTGSGCIIITLAKSRKANTKGQMFAVDISQNALKIARQNAKFQSVEKEINFIHGNLLEPVLKSKIKNLPAGQAGLKSKIIILANLPYLTPAQIKNSPSIQYEPRLALEAGKDGLKLYKELFNQIKKLLRLPIVNCQLLIVLEIDPGQKQPIKELIKKNHPQAKIQSKKDLCGLWRFVVISF